MRAVLFDLDDTLYPERTFVASGFAAVARHLASRHALDAATLAARLVALERAQGRGAVFDAALAELGLAPTTEVATLLHVYRTHLPRLALFADAAATLETLRAAGVRLGLVTDGMGAVQRRKIAALGLEARVDVVVCTDELGSDAGKPSTLPFRVALDLLGVEPDRAAYVGNDLRKDFLGPRALGMASVEVRRPEAGPLPDVPATHHADRVVTRLGDVVPLFLPRRSPPCATSTAHS